MAFVRQATEALTAANYRTPKTVLGFFAIIVGILVAGATFAVGIFARQPDLYRLIVPVLIFSGALVVVVLVGVFITAWKDPTILMLGQVSGEVYIENRKLTLGDSTVGEFTEIVALPSSRSGTQIDKTTAPDIQGAQ